MLKKFIAAAIIVLALVAVWAWRQSGQRTEKGEQPEATSPLVASEGPGDQFVLQQPDEGEPVAFSPEATAQTSGVPAAETVAAVGINDDGFSPAEITVAPGTTVIFINNGQAAHWPASDPHPLHIRLPGFDAKRALQTGEEYSFTFVKTGSWTYHDHLNSAVKGTVIVK